MRGELVSIWKNPAISRMFIMVSSIAKLIYLSTQQAPYALWMQIADKNEITTN